MQHHHPEPHGTLEATRTVTLAIPVAANALCVAAAAGAIVGGYAAVWWMRRQLKAKRSPRRIAGICKLRPEKEDQYTQLHDHTWQEVMEIMYKNNIRNFSVFLHKPSSQMFSYFEYVGKHYDQDMANIAKDPVVKSWWSFCEPCQEPLKWEGPPPSEGGTGGMGGEWWASMTNINHCGAWPVYWTDRMPDPDFKPQNRHGLKSTRETPPQL
eukprot:CAMPEP_0171493308 /NCGR_PEP_ID=MMETSP0958-20121227/4892_1 /TAXON_ID=87120 /ORGANISM="Aurantiochytrium limacinum, Strain ATCCMYA-1381" /LENGTH=210 /DNA_ID=CAMNT_0012026921 /DNA_START=233 /DNA_END=865 /DNA_ORIENTATION=-